MKSAVILSCVYDDWESAQALFSAIDSDLYRLGWNWKLVIVDDGSHQALPLDFLAPAHGFGSVEVITLMRNVGHQRAIAVGLAHIFETMESDAVVVMDADGEDRPEDVVRLAAAYSGLPKKQIVFAERTRRSESAVFRAFYRIYCFVHVLLTGYRIRFGNFSIVPRSSLRRLVVDPNLWLHFAASVVSARIPYTTIPCQRGVRLHGKSKLNFTSLVIHGLAAISCYNEVVGVRLIFSSAFFSVFIGILAAAVLVERLATPWAVPGWATSAVGLSCVLLLQTFLIALALIAFAIGGRKSNFFFPMQQHRAYIDHVRRLH